MSGARNDCGDPAGNGAAATNNPTSNLTPGSAGIKPPPGVDPGQGFVRVFRSMQNTDLWPRVSEFSPLESFLDVLMQSRHNEVPGAVGPMACRRGEVCHSWQGWADRWNLDKYKARRRLRGWASAKPPLVEIETDRKTTTRVRVIGFDFFNGRIPSETETASATPGATASATVKDLQGNGLQETVQQQAQQQAQPTRECMENGTENKTGSPDRARELGNSEITEPDSARKIGNLVADHIAETTGGQISEADRENCRIAAAKLKASGIDEARQLEAWQWYAEHCDDPYVPQINRAWHWCDKWAALTAAMKRPNGGRASRSRWRRI